MQSHASSSHGGRANASSPDQNGSTSITGANAAGPVSSAPPLPHARLAWDPPLPAQLLGRDVPRGPGLWCCGSGPDLNLEFRSAFPGWVPRSGEVLEARIMVPSAGPTLYRGRITQCHPEGPSWRFRTAPLHLPYSLAKALSAWLVFTAGIPPAEAYRVGFPLRIFRGRLDFRYAATREDYAKVLELRKDAYTRVGKAGSGSKPEDMVFAWDNASRILCAFHGDVLVASAAICFANSEDDVLVGESIFPGNRFPGPIPPRRTMFEINRLCMHRGYRGGDVREAVFEQIAGVFLESGRDWFYCLCDRHLKPIYLSLGFEDTGAFGTCLGKEHYLLKAARGRASCGSGLSLSHWSAIYGSIVMDRTLKGYFRPRPGEWPRLLGRLFLHPFLAFRLRRAESRAFAAKLGKRARKDARPDQSGQPQEAMPQARLWPSDASALVREAS